MVFALAGDSTMTRLSAIDQLGSASGSSNTQVFHARAGLFLAGLARQHHQHQPLEPVDVDVVAIERHQPVDDDLALQRREDALAARAAAGSRGSSVEMRSSSSVGEHAQRALA